MAGWGDVAVIASGGTDTAVAKVLLQGDYAVVCLATISMYEGGNSIKIDQIIHQPLGEDEFYIGFYFKCPACAPLV